MSDWAIRTDGLAHRFGSAFELRDVNLRVPRGAVYGFLGPNGAGKTTTVRLLLGQQRIRKGTAQLVGYDVPRDLPLALARIGYVPERPHIYGMLRVREAMEMHAAFWRHRWNAEWARRLQDDFELDGAQVVSKLSKGQAGKLMMLLALAQRPDLLILDEPTDGLDPVVRRDVLAAVLDYVGESGASVFISSHLVHELERICDWVGVLEGGTMVAEMPMQAFKDGIKRLRVLDAPPELSAMPFTVVQRSAATLGRGEEWLVRGWQPSMSSWFDTSAARLHEVVDLDLEDGFVELLRAARARRQAERRAA